MANKVLQMILLNHYIFIFAFITWRFKKNLPVGGAMGNYMEENGGEGGGGTNTNVHFLWRDMFVRKSARTARFRKKKITFITYLTISAVMLKKLQIYALIVSCFRHFALIGNCFTIRKIRFIVTAQERISPIGFQF